MNFESIQCAVCGNQVVVLSDENETHYWEHGKIPASKYWNNEKREVYCSPICSMKSIENEKI